jgi:hypothetical protein
MLYQLPNGKVIHISIEEYLNLSDQDIQDLSALNLGDYATSPWTDSAIKKPHKYKDPRDINKDIDYTEESDEIIIESTTLTILTIDEIESSHTDEDTNSEELEDT